MTNNHNSKDQDYQIRDELGATIYELQSIVTQGRRVIHDHNRDRTEGLSIHSLRDTTTRMDEMFFLIVLTQAFRWLDDLEKLIPEFEPTFSEFKKMAGGRNAKTIRNKREHADEIYGSKQKNSKKENPLFTVSTTGGPTINMSSSVTDLSGGRVVLGGRVDVQATVEAAATLVETLRPVQLRYWTTTTRRGREKFEHFLSPKELISH